MKTEKEESPKEKTNDLIPSIIIWGTRVGGILLIILAAWTCDRLFC